MDLFCGCPVAHLPNIPVPDPSHFPLAGLWRYLLALHQSLFTAETDLVHLLNSVKKPRESAVLEDGFQGHGCRTVILSASDESSCSELGFSP